MKKILAALLALGLTVAFASEANKTDKKADKKAEKNASKKADKKEANKSK